MRTLTSEQRRQWATDRYLHLEGVLDADQVAFFSSEMDRIRTVPGWEPDRNPELPIERLRLAGPRSGAWTRSELGHASGASS